jgi:uncharacterized protein with HEPN domain
VRSDLPYLGHIADSIAAIETYVVGGREHFMRERLIQDAVIRNFEIIGEAASRLSVELRGREGVPWRRIIAFRNRLIRGYWSVDLLLVWDVVTNDPPLLKSEVRRLLAGQSGPRSEYNTSTRGRCRLLSGAPHSRRIAGCARGCYFENAPSISALTPRSASGVSTSTSAALPSSGTSTTASP